MSVDRASDARLPRRLTKLQVLLWPPQLLAYARLALVAAGLVAHRTSPLLACCLFLANMVLDGVDGALARRLGQATQFGAFLDVAVDVCTRGLLWALAVPGPLGALPLLLEALTFTCTHTVAAGAWKTNYFLSAPAWAAAVMRNGFKSPPGCLAIAGLMGLPLWLYAARFLPGTLLAAAPLGACLAAGRLLCAAVELWVLGSHLSALLAQDVADRAQPA